MNFSHIKDPKWANAEHTAIDCMVDFDAFNEDYVAFTAVESGDLPHTHEIFARCVAGEFGEVAEYTPLPPLTVQELAAMARRERDELLAKSDWTQLPDIPQSTKDLWAPYRQALRDITTQVGFPSNIDWPAPPQ